MEIAGHSGEKQGASRGADRPIGLRTLLWAAPIAGIAAAALNAVLFLVAASLGAMPETVVVQGRGGITLGAVISISIVAALVAGIILALFGRFTRRPLRYFLVLAAGILGLSFVTPFSLVGAPGEMIAVLLLMHVVAAITIVGLLSRFATR